MMSRGMMVSHTSVVGRDEELAALTQFLGDAESFPRALILEGEPGIGKTTVWREALETAESRVLAARPSAAEAQLSFAGLQDLLSGVLEEALADLPGPQRRALEVALALADPEAEPPDQGAIAFAFLGAVQTLVRSGPVVLAIDD